MLIFIKFRKKICFSLHYNAANSFLYANGLKIHHFKAKDSEIKQYPLCFGNLQCITLKKTGLSGKLYGFSVNYETIDVSDIIDIHKYLMKKKNDIV